MLETSMGTIDLKLTVGAFFMPAFVWLCLMASVLVYGLVNGTLKVEKPDRADVIDISTTLGGLGLAWAFLAMAVSAIAYDLAT